MQPQLDNPIDYYLINIVLHDGGNIYEVHYPPHISLPPKRRLLLLIPNLGLVSQLTVESNSQ